MKSYDTFSIGDQSGTKWWTRPTGFKMKVLTFRSVAFLMDCRSKSEETEDGGSQRVTTG